MNMSNEMLEILIGKQIDSEITPAEKRLLDRHLESDEQSRKFMDELNRINDIAAESIDSRLAAVKPVGEIFEAAWEKTGGVSYNYTRWLKKNLKFAFGLAAGLMIGITLQMNQAVLDDNMPGPDLAGNTTIGNPVAENEDYGFDRPERNLDLYMFTDTDGRRWMMEAYKEDNNIQPAIYYKGF